MHCSSFFLLFSFSSFFFSAIDLYVNMSTIDCCIVEISAFIAVNKNSLIAMVKIMEFFEQGSLSYQITITQYKVLSVLFIKVLRKCKHCSSRSTHLEVFCKNGALRNFAKFTRKHLCQSLFFIKLKASDCNFIKKETLTQVLSCVFCEISQNTFSYKTPPMAASVPFHCFFNKESIIIFKTQKSKYFLFCLPQIQLKYSSFSPPF